MISSTRSVLAAVRCTETDQKGLKIAAAAATATAVTAFFYIPLYSSKLVTELTPPALNSKAGFRDKPRRAELRLRAELSTAASAATVLLLSLVSRPDADSDRIADSDSSHRKSSTFLSWPPLGDSSCSFSCAPGCLCSWHVLYSRVVVF